MNSETPPRPPTLRTLEKDEPEVRRAMGVSLAGAFWNEPNFTYMLPDPSRRMRALQWFFGSFVARLGLRSGRIDVAREGAAAAVWVRPGATVGPAAAIASGMLAMPMRLGLRGTWRSQKLGSSVEAERSRQMHGPHWYLMALGVDPDHQGSGLGRKLVSRGVARADRARLPCYLETFRSSTAGYYEDHGFAVVGERRVGDTGPEYFAMVRKPERIRE